MNRFRVGYHYYYSLVFKSRNGLLQDGIYEVPFEDWVKAGIAYNTRAKDMETRRIIKFVRIYKVLCGLGCLNGPPTTVDQQESGLVKVTEVTPNYTNIAFNILSEALTMFYEDLFDIYRAFVDSSYALGDCVSNTWVVPAFDNESLLQQIVGTATIAEDDVAKAIESNASNLTFAKAGEHMVRQLATLACATKQKGLVQLEFGKT